MICPKIGDHVFVRSNTRDDYIGEVVAIAGYTLQLKNCSWVSESGRFHIFLATGTADGMEIEYMGDWTVNWSGWKLFPHELPTESI